MEWKHTDSRVREKGPGPAVNKENQDDSFRRYVKTNHLISLEKVQI